MSLVTLLFIIFIAWLLLGGGYYGYYRNANPAPGYGYAPGLGGILVAIIVIVFIVHYVLHLA